MKQGIVAILGSDAAPTAASIRRTLSADMSSKKWLEQNEMKKIVSSEQLIKLPPADDAEDRKSPPLTDVWASILVNRKTDDNSALPPLYVHSPVKRSSSGLSEKSLEICTESLGSETGSDCFSSEGAEDRVMVLEEEMKELNLFCGVTARYKESPARPSPPPIRCISGEYGPSVHMNSRRENGRLVVEAISVPSKNCFQAQRCDGRLVLSLVHAPAMAEDDDGSVADFQNVFNDIEEVQEETDDSGGDDDEAAEEEFELERSPPGHKPPVLMKNLIGIGRRNRTTAAAVVEDEFTVPQSLPPTSRVPRLIPSHPATAVSFNAYDYFWRNMSGGGAGSKNKRQIKNRNLEVVVMNPYIKGCKDGRRSLLIWEPSHCIATT